MPSPSSDLKVPNFYQDDGSSHAETYLHNAELCVQKYILISYRKIPKISPSKYKPPGGLYLENCPQIQSKTKQKQ